LKKISNILFVFLIITNNFLFANTTKEKIDNIISELEQKYKTVQFVYDNIPEASWEGVNYLIAKEDDYDNLLKFVRLLNEEFSKHSPDFIEKIDLKYIAIVKKLNYEGQHRAALPDAYKEIIFYDILKGRCDTLWTGVRDKYYLRHTIHHEIYHMVEEQINGNFYYKDSIWATFNDTAFHYGFGGETYYPDMKKKHKKKIRIIGKRPYGILYPTKGIITTYGQSALEEDKAEIFASLFIHKEVRKVNRLSRKDEIISKKVKYMKHFLESVSYEITDTYWESLF